MIFSKYIKNCITKKYSEGLFRQTLELIKNKIIEQAKKELSECDKKNNVDSAVIDFIKSNIKTVNPLVNALMCVVIDYVPILTQCIYDNLKKYVDGLTEV